MTSISKKHESSKGLPDFIVIGAMKTGTTSLQQYLESHPDISMSPKELNFFSDGINWHRGFDWYQKHFQDHDKVQGEISPSYSKCHAYEDIPGKIHSAIPDVKLIYVLREPVARIISHLSHAIGADIKGRSQEEIIKTSLDHCIDTSRYMAQLKQYLEYFDKDQILIVTAEKLRHNRQETLSTIFRFLGVNESFSSSSFEQTRHDSSAKVKRNRLGRALARYPMLRRLEAMGKSVVPNRMHPLFARLMGTSFEKPLLSEKVQEEITELLRNDIRGLKELTGYDFEEWNQ